MGAPVSDDGRGSASPDAVLLCGGRGTRLAGAGDAAEKPLVCVGERPMVARVIDALAGSEITTVHAVTSPDAPETATYLRDRRDRGAWDDLALTFIAGTGAGYVADLGRGLEAARGGKTPTGAEETAALTVVADLPLLRSADVADALAAWRRRTEPSLTVCVPAAFKRELGASVDTSFAHEGASVAPTGLNVVGGAETVDDATVVWDRRSLAVNVNRPSDLRLAERLAGDEPEL